MSSRVTLFTSEGDVDLHGVFHRAKESRQRLDEKLTDLVNKRAALRRSEANMAFHEITLSGEFRGKNPDMSQTQFDKQVKAYFQADAEWCAHREDGLELKGEVDALEADVSVLKRDIQIDTARMNSLAGYLFYLGAEKLSTIS